jgi:dipeptidase E
MKLYLSADGVGDEPQKLIDFAGNGARVGVIVNAADLHTPAERQDRLDTELAEMQELGFEPEELYLRAYFKDEAGLEAKLRELDMVWVRGGNVFVLRRAMRASGFDKVGTDLIRNGKLVYAGYSAGAVAAGYTLQGVQRMDDFIKVPEGYPDEVIWEGLELISEAVVPHFGSSDKAGAVIDDHGAHNRPCRPLRNGEVIVKP